MTENQLRACLRKHEQIESIKERIRRIESGVISAGKSFSASSFGNRREKRDEIGDAVAKLEQLRKCLCQEIILLENQILEVEQWLGTLTETQAIIMRLRYVDGFSWELVAQKSHYSKSHCLRINRKIISGCRKESNKGIRE